MGIVRASHDSCNNATPYDSAPRFLIRDNDGKFGRDFAAAATSADMDVVPIPPRSPNLNAICERFLGGLRRECLDHVLSLGRTTYAACSPNGWDTSTGGDRTRGSGSGSRTSGSGLAA